jgi:hypothetical protein
MENALLTNVLSLIDEDISRLQQARVLLDPATGTAKRKPGRPAKSMSAQIAAEKPRTRKKMSAEAREKIRQAQIKRWAMSKKSTKASAKRTSA